ncbi:MAG: DnaJ domain-containing protein [Desulfobacterales bacterium]|nr:DnaJ domain-containing protein [Desulfobacterales bacterium]
MDLDQGLRVLGLEKNTDAETGRRAWRARVRQWHPDRFAHNPEMQVLAEKHLKEINRAWEIVAPQLAGKPKDRDAAASRNTDRSERNPGTPRGNAATVSPRPAILKALRRIHLRRILKEIFTDPYRASTSGSGGSDNTPRIRKEGNKDKSFDEVFNEVSDGRPPERSRLDGATVKKDLARHPRPYGASTRTSGAVEGVEATDRVDPVRRPGRVKGIGRKR